MQTKVIKPVLQEERIREPGKRHQPTIQQINLIRIKVDPKIIKRFDISLGEREFERFGTPRRKYDWTKSEGFTSGWANVDELAESIRRDGMLHTPLVCSFKNFGLRDNLYAVYGWRRIRAAIKNKYDFVEVNYTEDLSPEEAEILSFKENFNREPLSDSEISEFLWRVKKRHPDWSYEKIGEVFGLGGRDPETRRKIVGTYISHYDFLERHRNDVKEFDIKLKDLTRTVTMQIRATAREIAGEERREEFETEILRAFSKNTVPISLLCKTLRSEFQRGNLLNPLEAVDLLKKNEKIRTSIRILLTQELVRALEKYEPKSSKKKGALGAIILEIVEKYLREKGYLEESANKQN